MEGIWIEKLESRESRDDRESREKKAKVWQCGRGREEEEE